MKPYKLKQLHLIINLYKQQGWIQHDLVGGVGGCSASPGAELCWSCVPPAHQLASLRQSLAWLLYLNCNCCSQFAYHHVITQITVSNFASNQRRNEGLPTMHCISLLFTITIFNEHLAKSCWNTLRFWFRISRFFKGMFLYLYYLRT
jgi:hypothetical protein